MKEEETELRPEIRKLLAAAKSRTLWTLSAVRLPPMGTWTGSLARPPDPLPDVGFARNRAQDE
jgi:hypothetical protein